MDDEIRFAWDPIAEARRQWAGHGWRSSADGMAMVTSVIRVHQLLMSSLDRVLRPFDITFARYEVLMLLHFSRTGELPMRKIGQRLQVHPASVTNAIDRLEAAELVSRNQHPTDRRTALIRLTPAGQECAIKATEALNRDVFQDIHLDSEQTGQLFDILAELRRNAGDF